jgi:hypothetical protein
MRAVTGDVGCVEYVSGWCGLAWTPDNMRPLRLYNPAGDGGDGDKVRRVGAVRNPNGFQMPYL